MQFLWVDLSVCGAAAAVLMLLDRVLVAGAVLMLAPFAGAAVLMLVLVQVPSFWPRCCKPLGDGAGRFRFAQLPCCAGAGALQMLYRGAGAGLGMASCHAQNDIMSCEG